MKKHFYIFVELLVIVLLSVASPSQNYFVNNDATCIQVLESEIEEEQEIDVFANDSSHESESIDDDGAKKHKLIGHANTENRFGCFIKSVESESHSLDSVFSSKPPRYILYCSLVVYS